METSVTPTLLPLLAQGSLDVSADKDKDFFINKIGKLTSMKLNEVHQLISTGFKVMMIIMIA